MQNQFRIQYLFSFFLYISISMGMNVNQFMTWEQPFSESESESEKCISNRWMSSKKIFTEDVGDKTSYYMSTNLNIPVTSVMNRDTISRDNPYFSSPAMPEEIFSFSSLRHTPATTEEDKKKEYVEFEQRITIVHACIDRMIAQRHFVSNNNKKINTDLLILIIKAVHKQNQDLLTKLANNIHICLKAKEQNQQQYLQAEDIKLIWNEQNYLNTFYIFKDIDLKSLHKEQIVKIFQYYLFDLLNTEETKKKLNNVEREICSKIYRILEDQTLEDKIFSLKETDLQNLFYNTENPNIQRKILSNLQIKCTEPRINLGYLEVGQKKIDDETILIMTKTKIDNNTNHVVEIDENNNTYIPNKNTQQIIHEDIYEDIYEDISKKTKPEISFISQSKKPETTEIIKEKYNQSAPAYTAPVIKQVINDTLTNPQKREVLQIKSNNLNSKITTTRKELEEIPNNGLKRTFTRYLSKFEENSQIDFQKNSEEENKEILKKMYVNLEDGLKEFAEENEREIISSSSSSDENSSSESSLSDDLDKLSQNTDDTIPYESNNIDEDFIFEKKTIKQKKENIKQPIDVIQNPDGTTTEVTIEKEDIVGASSIGAGVMILIKTFNVNKEQIEEEDITIIEKENY